MLNKKCGVEFTILTQELHVNLTNNYKEMATDVELNLTFLK